MKMSQAYEIAEIVWSEGNAIGVVQRTKDRFLVGVCYVDGRATEIKGRSAVDFESAFANAVDQDSSLKERMIHAFKKVGL